MSLFTVMFNPVIMPRSERHSPTHESGFARTSKPTAAASTVKPVLSGHPRGML